MKTTAKLKILFLTFTLLFFFSCSGTRYANTGTSSDRTGTNGATTGTGKAPKGNEHNFKY
jgi:hypothetical protein